MNRIYLRGTRVTGARRGMFEMDDPSTGEPLVAVHTAATSQMRSAAVDAREALRAGQWPRTHAAYRSASVRSLLAKLETGSRVSIEREVSELGTPISAARSRFTQTIDRLGERIPNLPELDPEVVVISGDAWSRFEDWAVVAVEALSRGGAVLLAPHPRARAHATSIVEAADAANMLSGLVALLPSEDARELASSPVIDRVVWLGRRADAVGLAEAAASHVASLSVIDPTTAVVADDKADANQVAAALAEAFGTGSGPATPRVGLVHEAIAERVGKLLAETAVVSRIGRACDAATEVGPVADAETLQHALDYSARVGREGGGILCGGTRISGEGLPEGGRYLAPTVLTTRREPAGFLAPLVTLCVRDRTEELLAELERSKAPRVRVLGDIDPSEVLIVSGSIPL
ncbi:MAG: aldehyde dehydrogenase family protein [Actinomycetota bacterium]